MANHAAEGIELSHILVVLARPSEPRNIGATCRAIRNFGITRLTIVTDNPIDYDAARPLAVGVSDTLEAARVVDNLGEAVEGASLVAGITRRLGKKRKSVSFNPGEFAVQALGDAMTAGAERTRNGATPTVAVVFGNEQHGLSDAELEHCHIAVSITTHPDCPSLNLSHAVEVICYELYRRALEDRSGTPGWTGSRIAAAQRISTERIEASAGSIVESLERLSFHTQDGPQGMKLFMRDLIARAGLSTAETKRFEALFTKLAGMHGRR